MKIPLAFIVLVTLALAPCFAGAELIVNTHTNDFTLSSPGNEQIKLCSCQAKAHTLRIENTGQFPGTYELKVETNYPGIVRLSQPSAKLEPYHAADIFVYLEDSCSAAGTYSYLATAKSNHGRLEQLERTIRIDPCRTGSLNVIPEHAQAGLCQDAAFKATVRNVGTYPDTFTLHADDKEVARAYLQPGELLEQDVRVGYACTQFGTMRVPFTLLAEHAGEQAKLERTVEIRNEYDASLGVEAKLRACARTRTHLPVTITNSAPAPDRITLRVDGPVMLEGAQQERTLEIGANTSAQLQLEVPPDVVPGTYDLSLLLTGEHGGVSKERTAQLTVDNCYDPAVEVRAAQDAIRKDRDCCGQKTYFVNVRNNGDREQRFQIVLEGPSFFALDETSVLVRASENVNVALRAYLPCSGEDYKARVTVFAQGQPHVNASASLHVESLSTRACYQVQIGDDEIDVRVDAHAAPIIVEHVGIRAAQYEITTNSTLFSISEERISLEPGERKEIHIVPKENLSTKALGRYIVSPTLTLKEQGLAYEEAVGVELRSFTWLERLRDWLASISLESWTVCARIALALFAILILLMLLLLLVYAGKATLAQSMPRHVLLWARALLLLAVAILLVSLALSGLPPADRTHERVALSEDATILEWYENEQLLIDLDEYFEDPDMDVLEYTAVQPENVNVHIEGSQMALTPDRDFAGEDMLIVTASDAKGGTAQSSLALRVIARKELTPAQWASAWCVQLSLLALIAIALVLFLLTLTIPERRQDLRSKNVLVVVPKPPERRARKRARKVAVRRRATRRRVAKRATRAVASRAIAIRPSTARAQPMQIMRGREGQTVNIAVGAPLAVPGSRAEEIALIGSKTGNTVHTPYCMIARRIPRNKRTAFSSRQEALRAGLVPCKACRPF